MQPSVSSKIQLAISQTIGKNSEFPRFVFANELIKFGLNTREEWITYAKMIVLNPKNKLGRILILLRKKKESLVSPAIIVARGVGSSLSESYIQPHTENKNCEYEKLSLIKGTASLIKFNKNGSPYDSIQITKKLISINPGEIHSVVFESPLVVLYEIKKVRPGLPKLFVKNSLPEDSPDVPDLLQRWHEFIKTKSI